MVSERRFSLRARTAYALNKVLALRLHFDDSTPANGLLRVLSGTHRMGVLTDDTWPGFRRSWILWNVRSPRAASWRCGRCSFTPHQSPRPRFRARILHIEYAAPGIMPAAATFHYIAPGSTFTLIPSLITLPVPIRLLALLIHCTESATVNVALAIFPSFLPILTGVFGLIAAKVVRYTGYGALYPQHIVGEA